MTWQAWSLLYLLVGFVLSWVGTHIGKAESDNSWPWELAAVVFWPITIVITLNKRPGHG